MNIYVAGSSAESESVAALIDVLRAAGNAITYDWPQALASSGLPANEGLTATQANDAARLCEIGVADCDLMIFLTPLTPTVGAWVELGFARAYGVPVVIVGDRPTSIFCAGIDCVSEAELLAKLGAQWSARHQRLSS